MGSFRQLSAMCGAITLMASVAQAQDTASSFDQLRVLVKPGDTVTVTGNSGGVMQGRIVDLSSQALGLQVDGQRRELFVDDVRTITEQRHANLATGAKWGVGIGAGFGVLTMAAATSGYRCYNCMTWILMSGAVYGGIGAGIGVGIAATMEHQQVIFAKPGSSLKLSVAPMVGRDRKGLLLTARW